MDRRQRKVLAIVALFLMSGALLFLLHVSIPAVVMVFGVPHFMLVMASWMVFPAYFLAHFLPYLASGSLVGQFSMNVPPRLPLAATETIIPDTTGSSAVFWLFDNRSNGVASYSTYDAALTAALAKGGIGSVLTMAPPSSITVTATVQQTLPLGWSLVFEPGTQLTIGVTTGTASSVFTSYHPWIVCKGSNTITGGQFFATTAAYQAMAWAANVSSVSMNGITFTGGSEGIPIIWENTTATPIQSLGISGCTINGGAGSLGYGMTVSGGHLEGLTFTDNEIVTSTAGGGVFTSPSANAGAIVTWEITGNSFTNFSTAAWTAIYLSNSAGAYGTSISGNAFVNLSTATNIAAQWIKISVTTNQRASVSIDSNSFDSVTSPAGNVGVLLLTAGWGVSVTGNDVDGGAANSAPNSAISAMVNVAMADITNLFRCSGNDVTYNLTNHILITSNQTTLTYVHNWMVSDNILNKCWTDSIDFEPTGAMLGLININGNRIADMNLANVANYAGVAINRGNNGQVVGPVVVNRNSMNTMDFTPTTTTYGIFTLGSVDTIFIGFNPAYQQTQGGATAPTAYNHSLNGTIVSSATYGLSQASAQPDGVSIVVNPAGTLSFEPVSLSRGAYPYLRYVPFYSTPTKQAGLYLNTVNSTISQANIGTLAIRPDGKEAWVVVQAGSIAIVNTSTLTVTGSIGVGTNGNNYIAFSPNGKYAYVTDSSLPGIWQINVSTHAVTSLLTGLSGVLGICVSPDGSTLYAASASAATAWAINAATGAILSTLSLTASTFGTPIITPDGNTLYVPIDRTITTVDVFAVNNNYTASSITVGTGPTGAAITPDGRYVYVANNGSTNVSVIDTSTNTVTATISVGNAPNRVWASTDGLWVYVSTTAGITIIQVSTNTVFNVISQSDANNGVLQITPNGELAFMASSTGDVYVFNIATNLLEAQDLTAQTTTSLTLVAIPTAGSLAFTPGFTGKVRVAVKVRGSNNTINDGWTAALLNGSTVLDQQTRTSLAANAEQTMDFYAIVSVTAGTTVTMNLQFAAVTGGTASVKVTSFEITPVE